MTEGARSVTCLTMAEAQDAAAMAEEAEKNQDADVDSTLLQELKLLSVVG